ncbi:MAG: hypothetical protein A2516_10035 [Alphaproteobacteria bacterium RIFOXYD12_FULL_60_8]|nr:MAG: hypothetical protein A2516_10035 [Alphaproteobacteria bacterium RIFOXYD12_FULL_60_8]
MSVNLLIANHLERNRQVGRRDWMATAAAVGAVACLVFVVFGFGLMVIADVDHSALWTGRE